VSKKTSPDDFGAGFFTEIYKWMKLLID